MSASPVLPGSAMIIRIACIAIAAFTQALSAAEPVDYARQIKPILKERCYSCHGALKQNGKLRLDTVALLKKGGKNGNAANHLLIERVTDADESSRMPPEGKPLTAEQIALLRAWMAQGATGPAEEKPEEDPRTHWAFQKPKHFTPAPAANPEWDLNPVDRFLAADQQKRGLVPAKEADQATLLRRVYLDLIGLPPTRDELLAFLNDPSTNAYEKVVDRLLASPQYGERWARHWMDIWRYSDWYGRRAVPDVLNSYAQVWRWRDWIVRSLNADRGYDEMVRLMLAADELDPSNLDDSVATGFLVRNFYRWNYNNWMRDNVEHTAKAFLGLTLNCCHCHDHKYDPVTHEEYFRFRAVFEPLEIRHDRWPGEADSGVYPKYNYASSYKPITSGMVRVMDEKLDAKTLFYTDGDERNVAKGKPPIPPGVPSILGGTYKIEPVALPPESWYPGLKEFVRRDEIAVREQAIGAAKATLLKAATTPDQIPVANAQLLVARSDLESLLARIAADDVMYRGVQGDVTAATLSAGMAETRHRFDLSMLDLTQKEVALAVTKKGTNAPATIAAEKAVADSLTKSTAASRSLLIPTTSYTPLSSQYPKASTGRRTALARWITDRENPLTARVAVNHMWAWHFGTPLVETTSNFGRQGKSPTNPELLDWLALQLMDNGWQMKPLHKLLVTSRAYRTSSTPERGTAKSNWVFATTRMEAEVVRDSLLYLAGDLDVNQGGLEIPQEQAQVSRRRSLYLSHHGETRAEILELFDAANPCDAYRRTTSVMPQQALALSNSEMAIRLARALAKKLPSGSDAVFVPAAFEHVLTRLPRAAELSASISFLDKQRKLFEAELKGSDSNSRARENLILALFNHTDFVTVR